MATDQEIIELLRRAFADEPRPPHFTDHEHCCECAEHDALLRARDPDSLGLADVGNAGWDPICFVTEAGFRYYLPALVRLALQRAPPGDWYLPQLLFHLVGDGVGNRRVACCTARQRGAVVTFLWYVVETRGTVLADYASEGELQRAIEIWSEGAN